jgi:hypothetical protein
VARPAKQFSAQGATEYLVLLAVVLIVALVSIALLGFFPGLSSDANITQGQAYWSGQAAPFKIKDFTYAKLNGSGLGTEKCIWGVPYKYLFVIENAGTEKYYVDAIDISINGINYANGTGADDCNGDCGQICNREYTSIYGNGSGGALYMGSALQIAPGQSTRLIIDSPAVSTSTGLPPYYGPCDTASPTIASAEISITYHSGAFPDMKKKQYGAKKLYFKCKL